MDAHAPAAALPAPATPSVSRAPAAGVWRLADPKISLASMASIFLGAGAAYHAGPLALGGLAVTVLGIFCIEVAKNASGEVFDWHSGVDAAVEAHDRSPFSGGKRVIVDGLLSTRGTWIVAAVCYVLGSLAGLALTGWRGSQVLLLGTAGVALAYFYHAPPLRLAYRGFGELAVGVAYGPLICAGTFLVQRGEIPGWVAALSLPLGILVAAFLWVNEFPDYAADRSAGKRTLVVRLGRARAARAYAALVTVAYAATLLLPLAGVPRGAWLGLLGIAPSIAATRILLASPDESAKVIPAQALTLIAFLVYAVGAGLGVALS